jgi:hypothetical protein
MAAPAASILTAHTDLPQMQKKVTPIANLRADLENLRGNR